MHLQIGDDLRHNDQLVYSNHQDIALTPFTWLVQNCSMEDDHLNIKLLQL